jgi:LysR family positive regulator for ilvC
MLCHLLVRLCYSQSKLRKVIYLQYNIAHNATLWIFVDLQELKVFADLCETLNFSATAQRVNKSPSALTRIVQRLEQETGSKLFARDNRTVRLTEAGARLREFAQQTLSHWQTTQQHLAIDNRGLTGELRIFCTVTAVYHFLPSILDRFRAQHPNVEIKLTTGDAVDALDTVYNNDVDIAFAIKPATLPNKIAFKTIGNIPLSIIAPADMPSDKWFQSPVVMPEKGQTRAVLENWYIQQKISPEIYAQVGGHEAIVSMVALGCGLGIAPQIVVSSSPMAERVKIINSPQQIAPLELGICCQKISLSLPTVQAFWQN